MEPIYRIEKLTLTHHHAVYRVVSGKGRLYQQWGTFHTREEAEACARERLLNEVLAGRDHSDE
jgi:hypothetical protein